MLSCLLVLAGFAALGNSAVDRAADEAAGQLRGFLERLKRHDVDLYEPIENGVEVASDRANALGGRVAYYDQTKIDEFAQLVEMVATSGHSDAHGLLFQAATFQPETDPVLERKRWRAEQPWIVRRLATDAFVRCTDPATDTWLTRIALTDRSVRNGPQRRELAARILARRGSITSSAAITKLLTDDSPRVRAGAARALGELGVTFHADELVAAADDPDWIVRLECILALDRMAEADPLGALRERMRRSARAALEDPNWSVRAAAADLLARTRDPRDIDALIQALEREQSETPGSRQRVRSKIRTALASLTGEDFASTRPTDWREWWHAAAADFQPAAEPMSPAAEQGARFSGIPIESDQVLFLLDASGSMRQPKPDDPGGANRWQIAVRELERCLRALRPGTRFNVVLFAEELAAFSKVPIEHDEEAVVRAMAFVRSKQPSGGTDLISALEVVFATESNPIFERSSTFEPDTVVLLSDGIPSRGAVLAPEQILFEITESNRSNRIAIHTISASGAPNSFLSAISSANHGETTGL